MLSLLLTRWLRIGVYFFMTAFLAVAIGCSSGDDDSADSGDSSDGGDSTISVAFRTGGGVQARGENERDVALGQDFALALPMTASEAVAAGWKDPELCRIGRGRYFYKGVAGEGDPYFLMFNDKDRLIGVYQFSEMEMPAPWEQMESLTGGGGQVIVDFEHWGLFLYFQDSTRACGVVPQTVQRGVQGKYLGTFVKSTPTPILPPTPTPAAEVILESAVAKTGEKKALSFELTGDPVAKKIEGSLNRKGELTLVKEGVVTVTDKSRNTKVLEASAVPFTFDSLAATLSGIAAALQAPVDTKTAYINNVKRRGVSGTVLGSDLSGLLPTVVADATVTVSLWFDEKDRIVRLKIEGAVTPDDSSDAERVLDVSGY